MQIVGEADRKATSDVIGKSSSESRGDSGGARERVARNQHRQPPVSVGLRSKKYLLAENGGECAPLRFN